MTIEHVVASAHRLRQLRQIAEAPTLRQRVAMQERQVRRQMLEDLAVALGLFAAAYVIGGLVS